MTNNSAETMVLEGTAESDKPNEPVRPTIWFKEIEFSDGTTLTFEEDEIVVFVGPNNAGKSAALKEMEALVAKDGSHTVVKSASLHKSGKQADLRAYLEKFAQKVTPNLNEVHYAGLGFHIHENHIQWYDNPSDRHPIAPFFSTRLATENRITASNQAGPIKLHQEAVKHPIHLLLMDKSLADKIGTYFHHAFGKELFPFRAGGSSFPLIVGTKPLEEDELSKEFVDKALSQAQSLETQGDGMRSFATVLLYILVADTHSIQFLDEPEAFLHPPQARLIGELIARERKAKSQLFIATHSADILDGLIAGGADKVRIVRIQREGTINRVKELSREKTAEIANDTLARFSGVFDGIFYQHVVICESDSDCLFYESLLNTKAVSGDRRADVLFIHTSGKHRMGQLAETLRELDVPVSVIGDIDVFNEEDTIRKLFELLGGKWENIRSTWKALKNAVEAQKPPMSADEVSEKIRKELEGVSGATPFPRDKERAIKRVFKAASPWDGVKRAGRSGLPTGQPVQQFDQLLTACAAVGLWVTPEGELEGFCRSIGGNHGPGFVEKVLEDRDLESDKELESAREFVRSILARARGSGT